MPIAASLAPDLPRSSPPRRDIGARSEPHKERDGVAMSQSSDMDRLTKDLRQAGKFRMTAIKEMRKAAKSTLEACATMRGEIARDYRAQTQKFLASLAKDVAGHRRATAHQIAHTQSFLAGMCKDVGNHRRAAAHEIARFRTTRSKAASHLRTGLRRQADAMTKQTENFMASLASAHKDMAKRQRSSLATGRRKLAAQIDSFLGAVHADRMKALDIWKSFEFKGGATAK